MKVSEWTGCYDKQWRGLIVPEAFSHPAKFSPGLIQKIYEHCRDQGYLKKNEIIGDPFGGIGGGGIFAAYAGIRWIGVELEEKFIDLTIENFKMHADAWASYKYPLPLIIKGDSRQFSSIIQPLIMMMRDFDGECDGIITSPPYADSVNSKTHGIDWTKTGSATGNRKRGEGTKHEETFRAQMSYSGGPNSCLNRDQIYGETEGQIGTLKVDSIVTSPPYSKQAHHGGNTPTASGIGRNTREQRSTEAGGNHNLTRTYGTTPGQIDETDGENYWSAMRTVYSECHKALKDGGYLIVVIKAYVKNKRRVPLPQQTLKLLIHLGFEPVERIKALLTKKTVQGGLFGKDIIKTKSRKSFFRRLAESKGSPKIDWEEVLICRK